MHKRIHIAIVVPAPLIRSGLIATLHKINEIHIDTAELGVENLSSQVIRYKPEWMIISLNHFDATSLQQIKNASLTTGTRLIGLQSDLSQIHLLAYCDTSFTLFDTQDQIKDKLMSLLNVEATPTEEDQRKELSQREREIIICIVKGMSNKQIADELFLSPHTIATHRRNIANKLQIHSSSGLTIYAIVNKLVDIDEIKL